MRPYKKDPGELLHKSLSDNISHNKTGRLVCIAVFGVAGLFASAIQTAAADEWLPVGGVLPAEITEMPDTVAEPLPILATVQEPASARGRAAAAAPVSTVSGGSRYGYEWISDSVNTGSSAPVLEALYTTLVGYAETTYASTEPYTQSGTSGYVTSGVANIASLDLPVTIISGTLVDPEGADTQASRTLLQLAVTAFRHDNPQYWMFANAWGYSYSPTTQEYTGIRLYIDPAYKTAAARDEIKTRVETKYQEYAALAATVTGDRDKIQLVHDKMLAERDYSYVLVESGTAAGSYTPDSNAYAHNILGVMDTTTRGPVCESFAEAFTYVLNRLDVGAPITVVGMAGSGNGDGSGGHAWNLVRLDGSYYYVDSTWDNRDNLLPSSPYYDEGNRFNHLYYKFFLAGSANTDFDAGSSSTARHWAGGPAAVEGNPYVLYGLPASISTADYTVASSHSFLTANGRDGSNTATTADNYAYAIGKSATLTGTVIDSHDGNPLYVRTGSSSYSLNRGPFTFTAEAGTTPQVPLYRWTYDSTGAYVSTMFPGTPVALTQGADYTVEAEPGAAGDTVRAWLTGTGATWRGIDFVMVTLTATANAAAPAITAHPQNASYRTGATPAPLAVTASVGDGGTLSYQWYKNTANATTGGTAVGINSASYTPTTTAAGTAYYYVVVTNTNPAATGAKTATITSNAAAITVVNPPSPPGFTANLAAATIVTNGGATLTVTATTSGGALSYQWQVRAGNSGAWQDVTGAVGASLTFVNLGRETNGRQYRVAVTAANAGGALPTVYSATTTLQVFVPEFFDEDEEQPASLAFGGSGTLYVGTYSGSSLPGAGGGAIHRIILTGSTGGVEKIAGGNGWGHANATGTAAQFGDVYGVAVAGGSLIVADFGYTGAGTAAGNFVLRRVDLATRAVTTIAGAAGQSGTTDGTGTAARFHYGPRAIAAASAAVVYVTDGHAIRKVTLAGAGAASVSAFAGDILASGTANAAGASARFDSPECLAVDASGNLYVGESAGSIRKVTPAGVVTTFTGTVAGLSPAALAVDNAAGGLLYVASGGSIFASPLTGTNAGQFSPVIGGGAAPFAFPVGPDLASGLGAAQGRALQISAAAAPLLPGYPVALALDPADGRLVIASEDTTTLLTLSSGSSPALAPLLLAEPVVTATNTGTGGGTDPGAGGGGASSGGGGGGGAAPLPVLALLAALFAWRAWKKPAGD